MIQNVPVELASELRAVLGVVRATVAQLEGILGAAEGRAREGRELRTELAALQEEHEAVVRALGEMRDRCQALLQERDTTARVLEQVVERLRR